MVDGHLEKVGNYNMEPPGAFRGRGEHPKMDKLKQPVSPEQVTMINVSKCAPVLRCEVRGAWSCVGGFMSPSHRAMVMSMEGEYQQSSQVYAVGSAVVVQGQE
jgi:DNA topoisomerase IB